MKNIKDIPGYKYPEYKMIEIPFWETEDEVKVMTISYEKSFPYHNLFCFIKYYLKIIFNKWNLKNKSNE